MRHQYRDLMQRCCSLVLLLNSSARWPQNFVVNPASGFVHGGALGTNLTQHYIETNP